MSHKIDIAENGTTTLLTAGKFCDRNIDINVNVASSGGTEIEDALISGTLSGHYRNDRVTKVKSYGFYSQTNLTSIDLPNATDINNYAFNSCKNLTTVNLPNVTETGTYTFWGCGKLISVNLPLLSWFSGSDFRTCTSLESIYLPSTIGIATYTFQECYNLKKVILGSTSVCKLLSTNAFTKCYHILGTTNADYNPNGRRDGYIYVPNELVEQYKVATNWSTYASQIMPLVETVDDLSGIDTTLVNHACVSPEYGTYTEYYFNGTEWEVFVR